MKKTFIAASLMAMAFLSTQAMAAEEMKKDTPAVEEAHAQHKSCCPMMQKKMEEMKHDHAMPADGMKDHDQ